MFVTDAVAAPAPPIVPRSAEVRYLTRAVAYRSADARQSPIRPTAVVNSVSHPTHEVQRCEMFEPIFIEYGLLPAEVFSYIAYRESRCRIKAINATWDEAGNMTWALNKNKSWDSGIFQINSSWRTVTRRVCGGDISMLLILDCNLKVAKYLLDNGGLNHWRATINP